MTQLAQSHDVSLLSLVDANSDPGIAIANAEVYCRQVETVPDRLHRVTGRAKRLLQLGSLVSLWSWEKLLYLRPALQRALDRHLQQHEYDVVVFEFAFMASYRLRAGARGRKRPYLVLDEHNVEYDLLRRTAETAGMGRRIFQELNWRKLKREEIATWRRFDACTLTSARDETFVRREAPGIRTAVVPNGVDIEEFVPRPDAVLEPKTILFFGAINYYPNEDGVLYFARRILPLLRALEPEVLLRVIGPVDEVGPVTDLRGDGVEVLGFRDDVKAEIARAALVVVPLRIGGGTRLKILEAMAMGKAIVSTSLGAEGIDVEHDKDILLADEPEEFARLVATALADAGLRERLGAAARQTAVTRYSWRTAADRMEVLLQDLQSQGRNATTKT